MKETKLKYGEIYQLAQWQDKKALYLGRLNQRKDAKAKHVLATLDEANKPVIYRICDDFKLEDNRLTAHPYRCVINKKEETYVLGLLSKLGITN